MKTIEEQVVCKELAIELRDNGYKQEGVFWWVKEKTNEVEYYELMLKQGDRFIPLRKQYYLSFAVKNCDSYVASTVAELGERLPDSIEKENLTYTLGIDHWENGQWNIYYEDYDMDKLIKTSANTEANARAKMRLYLKKKGLI